MRAIEDKSGEIGSRKDESQLRRDYELIRDGKVEHLLLRSVEGESISKVAQRLIEALQRDFPDRFTHQIITRDQAREIWVRGLEREPSPQLELPGVGEQARLQKERQREARKQERERQERARIAEREQRARDKELAQSVSPRELDEKRRKLGSPDTSVRRTRVFVKHPTNSSSASSVRPAIGEPIEMSSPAPNRDNNAASPA